MSRVARERRRRRARRGAGPAFLILGVVAVLLAMGALGAAGYVVSMITDAPDLNELQPRDQGETSVVYARDGTRLGFIQSDILRREIPGHEIPQSVKDATVAIEDERFFQHRGVDAEGVFRAALRNLESGRTVEGGSTLTMQLVRALYINNERTFRRKVHEAVLASDLEERESKRWILNSYLNNAPYGTNGGQTAVGIQAAARQYFDKPASRLELHEAAMLAGLPQAPSQYNPFREPEAALRRRNEVLRKMAELRMITPAQAREAMDRPLGVERSRFYTQRREQYFFDYVRQELIEAYGIRRVRQGGLRVYTTIDLRMQRAARRAISARLGGIGPKGAIVTINPRNGHILAMASSASYADSRFNLAAQGRRQPGSTFKIMGLMAALRRGVSPTGTIYTSKRLRFDDPRYGPIDVDCYSGCAGRSMNLVQATTASDNAVYQQLALDLGPRSVRDAARDMGITSPLQGYPSEVLGGVRSCCSPLEMANAYATIASGGVRHRPVAITRVVFADGTESRRFGRPRPSRQFTDGVAYEATRILRRNMTDGTGTRAQIGCPAAGKTGTTDEFTDAWFAGYTPNLATAVWVGYPRRRIQMRTEYAGGPVAGGTFPAEIWGQYMRQVRRGCGDFREPETPFRASPFFGRYATTGAPGSSRPGQDYQPGAPGEPSGGGVPGPGPGTDRERGEEGTGGTGGGGGAGGTGGGSYDPDLYETPPQQAPAVQTPATPEPAPTDGGAAGAPAAAETE